MSSAGVCVALLVLLSVSWGAAAGDANCEGPECAGAVSGQGRSAERRVRAAEVPMSSKDPGQRKQLEGERDSNDSGETDGADMQATGGVVEGRGKKLKKILPYLIAKKILFVMYAVIAYVVVALIAKAALLKGSLALALAGIILLKKLLLSHHVVARTEVKYHENSHTKTYGGGGYGGSYGGGAGDYGGGYGGHSEGGWDSYSGAVDQSKQYAHNTGHSVVYRGQKPVGR